MTTIYIYFSILLLSAISITLPPTTVVQETEGVATICVSLSRNSQAQREVMVELSINSDGSAAGWEPIYQDVISCISYHSDLLNVK